MIEQIPPDSRLAGAFLAGYALVTPKELWPADTMERLRPIIGRFLE